METDQKWGQFAPSEKANINHDKRKKITFYKGFKGTFDLYNG